MSHEVPEAQDDIAPVLNLKINTKGNYRYVIWWVFSHFFLIYYYIYGCIDPHLTFGGWIKKYKIDRKIFWRHRNNIRVHSNIWQKFLSSILLGCLNKRI